MAETDYVSLSGEDSNSKLMTEMKARTLQRWKLKLHESACHVNVQRINIQQWQKLLQQTC